MVKKIIKEEINTQISQEEIDKFYNEFLINSKNPNYKPSPIERRKEVFSTMKSFDINNMDDLWVEFNEMEKKNGRSGYESI